MSSFIGWFSENGEWVFSGVGVAVAVAFFTWFLPRKNDAGGPIVNTINVGSMGKSIMNSGMSSSISDGSYKDNIRILFIDDDSRFKVVKILQKSGWVHTTTQKDVSTLNEQSIKDAHILFVDIQGVGAAMGFGDEGLGLASAIKNEYPSKKVVIYSSESNGDRFHKALKTVDNFLSKNADPYEFQTIVEDFAVEISKES